MKYITMEWSTAPDTTQQATSAGGYSDEHHQQKMRRDGENEGETEREREREGGREAVSGDRDVNRPRKRDGETWQQTTIPL